MLVYVDTSVFGGIMDDEFAAPTKAFFDEVRDERFRILVSTVVLDELRGAPLEVRRHYASLRDHVTVAELSVPALRLVRQYLDAGIVTERWRPDAEHVAVATVHECRAIVSWNFRHIVHFEKIPLYNGVNMSRGYGPLAIHTPREMVRYEDNEEENI